MKSGFALQEPHRIYHAVTIKHMSALLRRPMACVWADSHENTSDVRRHLPRLRYKGHILDRLCRKHSTIEICGPC